MGRKVTIILGDGKKSAAFRATLLAAFVFAVALALLGAPSPKRESTRQTLVGQGNAMVTIDLGAGKERRTFSGAVFEGMTAADALQVAALAGDLETRFDERGNPVRIDGVSSDWDATKNDRPVDAPLVATPIQPGDVLVVEP